ncbi:MAG: 23S rRNA (uracil(1939)-C(5))-methyltransferase RlmD [Gammaproteobacteria bacterium]
MRARARPREPVDLQIDTLSHEGRGVARLDGKTVFVHGALPTEQVRARILRRRGRFDEAETLEVLQAAANRVTPRCAHFGTCGGCSLQHLSEDEQLRHKQQVLLELLHHHAGAAPDTLAEPVRGPQWGYRRKARLGVKHVTKKGGVIVGFRERASPYVTDCRHCDILDPRIGARLPALRDLIAALSIPAQIPQLEIALSDSRAVLVVRHLAPLSGNDRDALAAFARTHGVEFYLQSGGPHTITPLDGPARPLEYRVDDIVLAFEPADFIQVNSVINQHMVETALHYLQPGAADDIADLFCGIGNFTLPLARRAGHVIGLEGEQALIERARSNAVANGIDNCSFDVADLALPTGLAGRLPGSVSKLLLDPPRTGALAVVENLDCSAMETIVYVSCNPVTLARDAGVLIRRQGYRLRETGILDMFPHTAHVESISVFERR